MTSFFQAFQYRTKRKGNQKFCQNSEEKVNKHREENLTGIVHTLGLLSLLIFKNSLHEQNIQLFSSIRTYLNIKLKMSNALDIESWILKNCLFSQRAVRTSYLNHYFHLHVCPCFCLCGVCHTSAFHPINSSRCLNSLIKFAPYVLGVDPWGPGCSRT